ncbi:hypothetical protein EBF04_21455 [Streptomyces sp. I6]|nr:hypothetical protein EBF04_21455 [Streptomyces sp. I6]
MTEKASVLWQRAAAGREPSLPAAARCEPRTGNPRPPTLDREPRAASREPRTANREPRTLAPNRATRRGAASSG